MLIIPVCMILSTLLILALVKDAEKQALEQYYLCKGDKHGTLDSED